MKVRTITLILTLTLGLLVAPLAVQAQRAGKIPRVSFLLEHSSPEAASPDPSRALQKQLHELGYVEGQNIAFESRWAQGRVEWLPGLAAELIRLKADVIVTVGTLATLAAKQATTTIPIVMVSGVDPVGIGLVASYARPGGNVTGVTSLTGELSGKRLDLLREAVPNVSRLAVLWDPTNPSTAFELRETQVLARSLVKRVSIQAVGVRDPDEFESAGTSFRDTAIRLSLTGMRRLGSSAGDENRSFGLSPSFRCPPKPHGLPPSSLQLFSGVWVMKPTSGGVTRRGEPQLSHLTRPGTRIPPDPARPSRR